jgi:hypothetical protein
VREMKEDPSEPSCRGRLQTAMSCFGRKVTVVNVMVKRRELDHVRYGRERRAQANLCGSIETDMDDIKTGVSQMLREKHGGNLPTGHAVSGV